MSLVLADTSVWIDFFSFPGSPFAKELDSYLQNNLICTMDLIVAEILSGCRSEKHFQKLDGYLQALPKISLPENIWEKIALYRFKLTKKGYQVGIPDLLIAITASERQRVLFTKDQQFKAISKVMPLELKLSV